MLHSNEWDDFTTTTTTTNTSTTWTTKGHDKSMGVKSCEIKWICQKKKITFAASASIGLSQSETPSRPSYDQTEYRVGNVQEDRRN